MAPGIAGTSMIFASRVFHCAPNMADPSSVIKSTVHTGGSDGAMAGCGAANGRTGVAAIMTGGATGWCGVGMAAPLMWPPAMDTWVGGCCMQQYHDCSPARDHMREGQASYSTAEQRKPRHNADKIRRSLLLCLVVRRT